MKKLLVCLILVILTVVSFRLLWAPQDNKTYCLDFQDLTWINYQQVDHIDITFDNVIWHSKTSDQYSDIYNVKNDTGDVFLVVFTNDTELYIYRISDSVGLADF